MPLDTYYDPTEVGKRIRKARIAAQLKQSELSEEMCITEDMLSKIERGVRSCTPDNMYYLCKRFNKTADYFYYGRIPGNTGSKKSVVEIISDINAILHNLNHHEVEKAYKLMMIGTFS